MRSLSLRLTHKITAIGVIGLIGVVLVGGIHLYGENAVAVYRSAAESARSVAELNRQIEVELLEGRRAETGDHAARDSGKQGFGRERSRSTGGAGLGHVGATVEPQSFRSGLLSDAARKSCTRWGLLCDQALP